MIERVQNNANAIKKRALGAFLLVPLTCQSGVSFTVKSMREDMAAIKPRVINNGDLFVQRRFISEISNL